MTLTSPSPGFSDYFCSKPFDFRNNTTSRVSVEVGCQSYEFQRSTFSVKRIHGTAWECRRSRLWIVKRNSCVYSSVNLTDVK
jgi:hypothetical protein